MKHADLLKRPWVLPVLVILLVAHGIVFYHVFSHTTLTLAMGLALLVLLKHVGVFGPIYAFFKRRSRH
jgi:uncharacterized membrane protein HdeD (DUF308 family)